MIQNDEFLEQLIVKSILVDRKYFSLVFDKIEEKYFDEVVASNIFKTCSEYFKEYKNLPDKSIILNACDTKLQPNIAEYINSVESLDFDNSNSSNFDFLIDSTDKWIKEKAIKNAILDSVDIVSKGKDGDYGKIEDLVKSALSKTLKFDLGLNYFNTISERIKRKFSETDYRIPTYFPEFDEKISGGFPKKTLSIFIAKSFGGKSNFMINMASRQVLNGKNVALFSLEMSEDMFAQRLDSIYSGVDINYIYSTKKKEFQDNLVSFLKEHSSSSRGNLFIKSFPTGQASVIDIRTYLKELEMRGEKIDLICVDYINLMKSMYSNSHRDGLYEKGKSIAEELRALSYEFDIPVISVTQLRRSGSAYAENNLEEVGMEDISESMGVIHTADFAAIFGTSDDLIVYASEVHYKIVKNRIGGGMDIGRFYLDSKSLKLYDSSELDAWLDSAKISNDSREVYEKSNKKTKRRQL